MKEHLQKLCATLSVLMLTGCASYPVNPQLAQYDPKAGYRFQNLKAPDNSDSLFVILTF